MPNRDRTWTISELSREYDVTPRALRFYEDKGLLAPAREGMNRVYSAGDRDRLTLVLRAKRLGFPLSEIREILDLGKLQGRARLLAALEKLQRQLAALESQKNDIHAALEAAQESIAWVEAQIASASAFDDEEAERALVEETRRMLEER
jgi:DNA-binding transcriptional MerR regulator